MKYGESVFDIVYLLFAVLSGAFILMLRHDKEGKLMGFAALILGLGDAFHLVPRVLNYFVDADFTAWLGVGKLVTSVTMTVFYVLVYRLWLKVYNETESKSLSALIYSLSAVRIILCLLPQNRWLTNDGPMIWGIIRNLPFVALGVIIVYLFFKNRVGIRVFRFVWLLVALSFLFYIPVTVAAGILPILGMLMLPKTVCYMVLIWTFLMYSTKSCIKE
ncbi:MAG: hypothetical protein IKI68_04020 [Clostridia bacterium]|nr:hypothetical protein [Clostridia bacterium]